MVHPLAYQRRGQIASIPLRRARFSSTLTLAGWNRIQPLVPQEGRQGQCFVAMWFGPSVQLAYEEGITPAIVEGRSSRPVRLDRKEYNNDIADEIIAEIRNSEFVVAASNWPTPRCSTGRGRVRAGAWTPRHLGPATLGKSETLSLRHKPPKLHCLEHA